MKYEKPNIMIDLVDDIIVTSFLDVETEGGNEEEGDIVIPTV